MMNNKELRQAVTIAIYSSDRYIKELYSYCKDELNGDEDIITMITDYYNKFSKTMSVVDNIKAAFKYDLQQRFGYHFTEQFKRLADSISRKVYINYNIKECHCGDLYKNYIRYRGSLLDNYLLTEFIKVGAVKYLQHPSFWYSAVYMRDEFDDRFIYHDCYIVELEDDYLILKPNQFKQLFAEEEEV